MSDKKDNIIACSECFIKEAFVSRFDDNLARYYYINGSAREPKVIKLERSMIINTNNR